MAEGEIIKVATIGTAEGQEIVNITYWQSDLAVGGVMDPVIRAEFVEMWDTRWKTTMDPLLSADYVGVEHVATVVNVRNEALDTYPVIVPNTAAGEVAGGSDTVGLAAIVAQRCTAYGVGPGIRTPKKSYLVLGPIASANIGDSGLLLWNEAERETVTDMCWQPIVGAGGEINGVEFLPVRVGVPNTADIPAAGYVQTALVRQYTRPRKSRLYRANGR
jgi:hypothetical protein